MGGGQKQKINAQQAAEPAVEALEAVTKPLPARDRAACRGTPALLTEIRRALDSGASPTQIRRRAIDNFDRRGLPWPGRGAAHPVGLMAYRLRTASQPPPDEPEHQENSDEPPGREPCRRCDDRGMIEQDRHTWQPCPECRSNAPPALPIDGDEPESFAAALAS